MESATLNELGTNYAAAWCSQNAASVASFFAEQGSLTINNGTPFLGREAIAGVAREFMTTFPDMAVRMDRIVVVEDHVVFHWTLTGTNTGPGGKGKAVRISGFERWKLDADGLIAESMGHFDEDDYNLQLTGGIAEIQRPPHERNALQK